jgi:hypothetical protein
MNALLKTLDTNVFRHILSYIPYPLEYITNSSRREIYLKARSIVFRHFGVTLSDNMLRYNGEISMHSYDGAMLYNFVLDRNSVIDDSAWFFVMFVDDDDQPEAIGA